MINTVVQSAGLQLVSAVGLGAQICKDLGMAEKA